MILEAGVSPGTGYTFNKTAGTITFTGNAPPNLESILTVTNCTTPGANGGVLYQPQAGTGYLGTYVSPVLTLSANTSSMNNTDRLFILFDDGSTPTQRQEDLLEMLMRIAKLLETNAVVDSAQRQRITLDAISAALTLATVTTVGTVSTVTTLPTLANVTTVAGLSAVAGMDREQYINIARNAWANSIRSQLTFQ